MEIRLNSILLNNSWVKGEILKYFKLNEYQNITSKFGGDAAKAVLRGKFIALNAYIRKEERSRYSHLCVHHRKL